MKKQSVIQSKQILFVKSNTSLDKIKNLEIFKKDLESELKHSKNANKKLTLQNKNFLKTQKNLLNEIKQKKMFLINFGKTINKKMQKLELQNNHALGRLNYVESLNEEFLEIMDDQEKELKRGLEQREWLSNQLVKSVKENLLQDNNRPDFYY